MTNTVTPWTMIDGENIEGTVLDSDKFPGETFTVASANLGQADRNGVRWVIMRDADGVRHGRQPKYLIDMFTAYVDALVHHAVTVDCANPATARAQVLAAMRTGQHWERDR